MAQNDVLGLVSTLSGGQADATLAAQFYGEIVDSWGAANYLSNATLITQTATEEFTLPAPVRNVMGVIFDDSELGYLSLRELEALDPLWRNTKGPKPVAWTSEGESAKTLALYPTPVVAAAAPGGVPDPLGTDYPPYSIVLIHSESRTNVPVYFELPLALLILEREYARESDHADIELAAAFGETGRLLLGMVS